MAQQVVDLETLRHSAAHLMAAAVCELWPGAEYGIGPSIEDGFYYDFLLPGDHRFTDEDLPRIEARMHEIASRRPEYQRQELTREEALAEFGRLGQRFKLELIERIPEGEVISCYRTGDFFDLCRGPHVGDASDIPAFKLTHPAGAYWHGDETQPMLQRVYGTAWNSQEELDQYLERLEQAALRDHRKLGRELDLFSISEELGPGLILWHPNGAAVRTVIEDYWRQAHRRAGYQLVYTPHLAREQLWETSGHLGYFADEMFGAMEVEGDRYRVKPMSCPFHILIYKSRARSYRELPLRLAEVATVYRYQRSGTLHGLLRVRMITQDDAHIFCRPEQVDDEVAGVLRLVREMYRRFGFEQLEVDLSTKPAKAVGPGELWEQAESSLARVVEAEGLEYQVNPGEGAFYGPKVDVHIRDAIGRRWQCATVQFDFNEPARFGLEYIGSDGAAHQPVMIHRTLLGSLERFFGVLIEHYAGALPTWLSPVQVQVITVSDDQLDYAHQVASRLEEAGFRTEVPDRPGDRMGAKIRDSQLAKVPYAAIVGKQEVVANNVNLRNNRSGEESPISVEELIERLRAEVGS
ncbi:MAG TPA: threonine--tRNA ligase [Candidatus Dormibacteraeota bacterium]|nr:threonine--tRNA ligase [Candidatus Dormibacteraeota bacterium]